MNDTEKILTEVRDLIREVIAEEWVKDVTIDMQTSFTRDLELESIEFVALAERLTERYGGRINLAAWLSTKDLEEILTLRVGELVELIERCTSRPTTE